jgi:hypothetical protein
MNPPIVPECLSTQLKTCLLKGYVYGECWIQFAKYIMQNSKVLNTMSVKNVSNEDLKKLALSARASATCELVLN